ncbi:MAG: peptide deformylase [Candidatus Omnitrophica bacterium CG11_big_fil_rev_8_21_14_0_20_42_13]|uniref:Peptide deformylase n=1 Tax=Candidatus Ghiorseimicrobium undicola TaxID=1974746 RepID=A0A2H0LVD0_9BACT|nr:MAG: peptide deformylase [Candidatus Omnitrophica bacterium CG11_big_fil_rev_8_21_14_0_20_42_13]
MSKELKIYTYASPVLKKKTECLQFIGEEERAFFSSMVEIMHKANGVGLAANQVGVNKQMLVIDIGTGIIKIANPKIIKKAGRVSQEEGCLSLPDIVVKVCRAKDIVVAGINEHNQSVKFDAHDLLARVFQHEVDHLNGKLIIDYAPWHRKLLLKADFSKARKKALRLN